MKRGTTKKIQALDHDQSKLAGRYARLMAKRTATLEQAVDCSALTIPSIYPPIGHSPGAKLAAPYQSFGARAIRKLASKIMLALFPPNATFFRMGFDKATEESIKRASGNSEESTEIASIMSEVEQEMMKFIESAGSRPVLFQGIMSMLAGGNSCLYIDGDGQFRFYSLHNMVVRRDGKGNMMEMILKETVAIDTLSGDVVAACVPDDTNNDQTIRDDEVDLYTCCLRKGNRYEVWQEINGKEVPKSRGNYALDECAYIVPRWTAITGEDYGRSMVEEHMGDLSALNDLSRDLLKASGNAAKVVFAIKPGSQITPKKLSSAKNGDVIVGDAEDVKAITLDKWADFRVALERLQDLQEGLAASFLMNESVQRAAERVTAEEVRFVAQELEDALGGVYTVLAQELQAPIVRRVFRIMQRKGLLPALPKDSIKLTITTGLEALGRGHQVNKLVSFLRVMTEIMGQEAVHARMKGEPALQRVASDFGIDIKELFMTDDEYKQMQQQNMMQQMATDSAPGAITQLLKQQGTA